MRLCMIKSESERNPRVALDRETRERRKKGLDRTVIQLNKLLQYTQKQIPHLLPRVILYSICILNTHTLRS